MEETRLGDVTDDYCSKCGMVTNHSVVSLVEAEPAKTQCRTCYYSHKYRKGKAGSKKKSAGKKADLFDAVLASIPAPPPSAPKPDDD